MDDLDPVDLEEKQRLRLLTAFHNILTYDDRERTGYSDLDLNCPHAASPHKARTSADVPDSALIAGREYTSPVLNSSQALALGLSGLAGA